jgi:hypothetical protein
MKLFELLFDSVTKSGLAPVFFICLMKATPASSSVTMITACGSAAAIAATASSTLTVLRRVARDHHGRQVVLLHRVQRSREAILAERVVGVEHRDAADSGRGTFISSSTG